MVNTIKPAFLFPGQGSQSVGMGRDFYDNYPAARAVFEEADEALGFALSDIIFNGPDETLRLTEHTQPAILTVSVAALRVLAPALAERGILPKLAAGHSLGEYSAHVAAGTLSFADAVRAVRMRGRYMQSAVPPGEGAMAAILGLDPVLVEAICAQVADDLTPLPGDPSANHFLPSSAVVSAANLNSPAQTVISGAAAAVHRAAELCKEAGARKTQLLPVSAPFHCALMQPAQDLLAHDLKSIAFHDPGFPVVSNVDASFVTSGAEARAALVAQVTGPVRWVECVELLLAEGVTHFLEVGPGKVLSGLMKQIQRAQVPDSAESEPGTSPGPVSRPAFAVEDSASIERLLASLSAA